MGYTIAKNIILINNEEEKIKDGHFVLPWFPLSILFCRKANQTYLNWHILIFEVDGN